MTEIRSIIIIITEYTQVLTYASTINTVKKSGTHCPGILPHESEAEVTEEDCHNLI